MLFTTIVCAETPSEITQESLLAQYENMSEQEFCETLNDKSFNTLINEMNVLELSDASTASISYATALNDKVKDKSVGELRTAILNAENTTDLRGLLMQLAELCTENIPYNIFMQVTHNVTSTTASVYTDDIDYIRCGGVIEYCYEWYGYKIFGDSTYWNITNGGLDYRNHHYGNNVNPQTQAENYMRDKNISEGSL